jgi:hypothetical protein
MENSDNKDTFVIVAKFANSMEADIAKSILDNAEIQCFIDNENYIYSRPMDFVNLKVWGKDKEQALEILGMESIPDEVTDADDIDVVCPRCNSHNIYYGINRDNANTLFIVSAFFLQSLPFYNKKTYYCNSCGKHFKIKQES